MEPIRPQRRVSIIDVDVSKNEAHAVDQYGGPHVLRTDVRPWKSKGPEIGERWIISNGDGEWAFDRQIGCTDEMLDTSRIRGRTVADTVPGSGQGLLWNATTEQWEPTDLVEPVDVNFYVSDTQPNPLPNGSLWSETDTDRVHLAVGDDTPVRFGWGSSTGRTGGQWSRSTNLTVNNITITNVTLTTEASDSDGFLTPTSNTVTIPTGLGGLYDIGVTANYSGVLGAGGVLYFTAGANYAFTFSAGTVVTSLGGSAAGVPLAAGDTVQFFTFQNSGSSRNITSAFMYLWRVGS